VSLRVFPSLCLRARELGASKLHFVSELETMDGDGVSKEGAWSCAAYDKRESLGPLAKAYGRSGEEALRALVDKLEAS
jgi:hypothetical protein